MTSPVVRPVVSITACPVACRVANLTASSLACVVASLEASPGYPVASGNQICLIFSPWTIFLLRAMSAWGDRLWSFGIGIFVNLLDPGCKTGLGYLASAVQEY